MSDMMSGMGGGRPPMPSGGGMPPRSGGAMPGKMSMFNPTDMAAKVTNGDVSGNMTVAEVLQRNFGVSPNDPVQKLIQATKAQVQNRDMAGKLGANAGAPQPQQAPPQPSRPMPAPAPRQGGGNLDSLISRMS